MDKGERFFSTEFIDRLSLERSNELWLQRQLTAGDTRVLPVWRDLNLIDPGPPKRGVALPGPKSGGLLSRAETVILLGRYEDKLYLAAAFPPGADWLPPLLKPQGQFLSLRTYREEMHDDRRMQSLLAYAKAMAYWHGRRRHCSDCGQLTRSAYAGFIRICTNPACGKQHFPRTDPAIIVAVTHGDRLLLGRQPRWPEKRYSVVAGFVEPVESLETAVAREVMEETGVPVTNIRYQDSQPWPFPASLMLGFRAEATDDRISLNDHELEHAAWFSREDIRRSLREDSLRMPSRTSISFRLIRDWHDEDAAQSLEEVLAETEGNTQ